VSHKFLTIRKVVLTRSVATVVATCLLSAVAMAEPPTGQSSDLQRRLKIVTQIQQLQTELRELRGALEENSHGIDELKRRQKDFYLDLDRRLIDLEGGSVIRTPADAAEVKVPAGEVAGDESPVASPGQEQLLYQQSFDLLKAAKYDQAIAAFQKFLQAYPDGEYADNARYWVGEAYYVTRDFDKSLAEFNQLLKLHPTSAKLADAQLKVGYIYYEQKKWDQAREILTKVATDPASGAAGRLAITRLDRMTQEGH